MVFGTDGAEVDWFVGYGPPPENFQASLERILKGEETFKALSAAYAKNPKDVTTVFKLARKWSERYDDAKSLEKYKEVVALDPQGKEGPYTQEYYDITVPYTEFAEFSIATQAIGSAKPDFAPVRAFISKYPKSKLLKQAYGRMAYYYGYQATKEEAAKFFEEYTQAYPEDPAVLNAWLTRIVRDKEPLDKGSELAVKIRDLTRSNPALEMNQTMADLYFLKGDKAKADEIYGKDTLENQVFMMAYNLINYSNFWTAKNENKESALAMAETALKLEPENSYIIQQAAGVYFKVGREDKALALFGPAYMQKNIANDSALYGYATFWSTQGKNLDSALAAAKKTVELKPRQYYFWYGLGNAYAKEKNFPEALKAMEKAIELAPDAVKETYKKQLEKIKAEAEGKK
jgi:tetratricopeptide (TPR) repeat protein